MIRVAIAQLDPVVGAFEGNVRKILEAYERACTERARLLLTPEMGVCGYPPHDLMDRPEIFERNERAVETLVAATKGKACALIIGHVARSPLAFGRAAQNVATVAEDGKVVFRQAKTLLPTYDVFDEARYFEPAQDVQLWSCDGYRIALAICEDLWGCDPHLGKRLYGRDPIATYRDQKADLLFSISSSPYEWGKRARREELHRKIVQELKIPLVYVNQVGATDEILFDGASFAMDIQGTVQARLPSFQKSLGLIELSGRGDAPKLSVELPPAKDREDQAPEAIEVLARGLVIGIQEYFVRTGFKSAILGLSGGIDSAVVAVLAAKALGPKNVRGLAMPSQYSSSHSLEDATQLARNLGMPFEVRPIKFLFSMASRELAEGRGELAPIALENLQARLRGNILMTLSNHYSSLVLTTGNKSEIAMGYCTLYGDMAGALAPIGDVFKTRVYELAKYLNLQWGAPIPERTITKPPSAELRPSQTDQDTLPPYEILDELLLEYIEKGAPIAELEPRFESYFGTKTQGFRSVRAVLRCMEINEYKRRQAAPVSKVSPKAFGIGRRVPLAKSWDRDL